MADVRIAGPLTVDHPIEVCYGSNRHCHEHDRDDEPLTGYRWCLECWHMYATAAELLAEHNRVLEAMGCDYRAIRAEAVFCCPFCVHDW